MTWGGMIPSEVRLVRLDRNSVWTRVNLDKPKHLFLLAFKNNIQSVFKHFIKIRDNSDQSLWEGLAILGYAKQVNDFA